VDEGQGGEGAEMLNDIPLQIAVEIGRVPVTADEIVALKVGHVFDLNRVAGEPLDLSVNGRIVARGELVEIDGNLGVRILTLAG
jgi:type III secretion system YscQ/HrcQ family protein